VKLVLAALMVPVLILAALALATALIVGCGALA
jgi:hypothetical protein